MSEVCRLVECRDHRIAVSGPFGEEHLPAVVFIHGVTGSVGFWKEVLPAEVKQQFRWASVSLPCHYPSEPIGDDMVVDEAAFADNLADAIRSLFDGQPVHLVGWSTGGFSSLLIASQHPDLVTSVTSINGFIRGNWGNTLGMMQVVAKLGKVGNFGFQQTMKFLAKSKFTYQLILSGLASWSNSNKVKALISGFHQDYRQHDLSQMAKLFAGIRDIDATSMLKEIKAPCLVIGGTKDSVISPKETRHIAAHLERVELVEVAGCGHMFYCEAPETIWPKVTNWIKQHQS